MSEADELKLDGEHCAYVEHPQRSDRAMQESDWKEIKDAAVNSMREFLGSETHRRLAELARPAIEAAMAVPMDIVVLRHGTNDVSFESDRPFIGFTFNRPLTPDEQQRMERFMQHWTGVGQPSASPLCQSCRYHSANGFLPCAVHPSGPVAGECADWQA